MATLPSRSLVLIGILFVSACAGPNSHRTSVMAQILVGERMLGYGDYDRAYALLDKVAESNPRSSMAALGLADAYFRQKALLKAVAYYERAIELGAKNEGRLGLARVELARNNPGGAETLLRGILASRPNDPDALNAMGVVYDLEGQHEKAQHYYKSALTLSPADKQVLNNYSLSLALSGRAKDAYPFIAELSRSNQNDVIVRQNLSLVQHLAGDHKRALRTALLDLSEGEAQANFTQLSKLGLGP